MVMMILMMMVQAIIMLITYAKKYSLFPSLSFFLQVYVFGTFQKSITNA